MSEKLFIYSGIEPGKKGTGNFLSFFLNKLSERNVKFELISFKTPSVGYLAVLARKTGLIKILRSVYLRMNRFLLKNRNSVNAKIVIFHPQSIGLNNTLNLIKNNSKIYIYVLDTFFFCKSSYNYLSNNNSCLKCISDINSSIEHNCQFFLASQSHNEYLQLLQTIQENLFKICFLTQNENQGLLLKKKFGFNLEIQRLGMLIDLDSSPNLGFNVDESTKDKLIFDFVFHNTNIKAKGIEYTIQLAKRMPEFSFLIPYRKSELNISDDILTDLENLHCVNMSWETGLRYAVEKCRVVINPSLWSAPVEGALLKSIHFNGCVAVVPVDYSFQKEIPQDVVVHLHEDLDYSVDILKSVVESNEKRKNFKRQSAVWIKTYTVETQTNFESLIGNELSVF